MGACQNLQLMLHLSYVGTHCISYEKLMFGVAIVNIATDFALVLVPISRVVKLNVSTGQKVALSLVFSLGLL